MSEEIKAGTEKKTRRAFVMTAAQVAVTAPAVAMLLTATTKPAAAQNLCYPLVSQDDAGNPGGEDDCVPLTQ